MIFGFIRYDFLFVPINNTLCYYFWGDFIYLFIFLLILLYLVVEVIITTILDMSWYEIVWTTRSNMVRDCLDHKIKQGIHNNKS